MRLVVIVLFLLFPASAIAQQDDYQSRFLFHQQVVLGHEQGLAFWANLPDVTQTEPHRSVLLTGWLHKESGSWQEIMGGAFVTFDGKVRPIFDVRLFSSGKRVAVYSELMLMPHQAIIQSFAATPIKLGGTQLNVGMEWELLAPLQQAGKTAALAGPRVSFKVPGADWLQVAATYFFNMRGQRVLRTYVLVSP